MQLTQPQHSTVRSTPYCIGGAAIVPINHHAVPTVWHKEADMSVADGSRLPDELGLSGTAQQRNKSLIGHVRSVLAEGNAVAFAELMQEFSALVQSCGPLAYLRFNEEAFAAQMATALPQALARLPRAQAADPEALCDALHRACIHLLAVPHFINGLRDELQLFLDQNYIPSCDRLPACAALLTTPEAPNDHNLVVAELPALYAIFREQLIDWLQQAGAQQVALLHAATKPAHD
jgi:hypothetical protein